jgi:hypothetical protein
MPLAPAVVDPWNGRVLVRPVNTPWGHLGVPGVLSCHSGDLQPLTWQTTAPLCDVMPPRAMHRRAVQAQARLLGEPRADL